MEQQELLDQFTDLMRVQTETLSQMMEEHTREIKVLIENDVNKRIDAMADRYQLTHEKQWEQERKIATVQAKVEEIELRLLALEGKSA